MPQIYIALDLETTGLDAKQDAYRRLADMKVSPRRVMPLK